MLNEVIHYLNCRPGNVYVDGTLGGGGHARAICEKIFPGGTFLSELIKTSTPSTNAKTALKNYDVQISTSFTAILFVCQSSCHN